MARTESPLAFSLPILAITLASVLGAPSRTPLALALRQASLDPVPDHGPLKLREHSHHLKQRPARCRSRIDGLLVQVQVDACPMGFS